MNNQTQISGDQFGSGGGEMTIAKDQGAVIQIHELRMLPGRQQAAQQTIPCHLPPLDRHFVDREQQLAELRNPVCGQGRDALRAGRHWQKCLSRAGRPADRAGTLS